LAKAFEPAMLESQSKKGLKDLDFSLDCTKNFSKRMQTQMQL